jgi:hypothetical protein
MGQIPAPLRFSMPRRRTPSQETTRTSLVAPLGEAKERVNRQLDEGNGLLSTHIRTGEELEQLRASYNSWHDFTRELLNQIFNNDEIAHEFSFVGAAVLNIGFQTLQQQTEELKKDLQGDLGRLQSISKRLELFPIRTSEGEASDPAPVEIVQLLTSRFHLVTRQLRQRREQRTTLEVNDEYDVQDLLHALLRIYFDDIRPEEWTPSYAGGSSRMDFLLKSEQIVIEVKKTRQGLGVREVREQLSVDIINYRSHPDCKTLFCFVYDPDVYISNPIGIENDLSRPIDGMMVKVVITPKGQ